MDTLAREGIIESLPRNADEYRAWWRTTYPDIPYGFCVCGCGDAAPVSPHTARVYGWLRGEPKRYIFGHRKAQPEPYEREAPILCQCGCGEWAPVAKKTNAGHGHVRGKVLRFVKGHSPRRAIRRFAEGEMSHDLAYVVGFVLADGNICRNVTAIVQKDPEPLRRILEVLDSGHMIGARKTGFGSDESHVVNVTSKAFTDWLRSWGITERKSLTARLPMLPEPYMGDMIRGYFDGDGSAQYYPGKGFSIRFVSGSRALLDDFSEYLAVQHGFPDRPVTSYKGLEHITRLVYPGLLGLRLADLMYANARDLYIPRKWETIERYRAYKNATLQPTLDGGAGFSPIFH